MRIYFCELEYSEDAREEEGGKRFVKSEWIFGRFQRKTWRSNIQPIQTKTRRKHDSTRNQNSKLI